LRKDRYKKQAKIVETLEPKGTRVSEAANLPAHAVRILFGLEQTPNLTNNFSKRNVETSQAPEQSGKQLVRAVNVCEFGISE
jgi:hypothetical protein